MGRIYHDNRSKAALIPIAFLISSFSLSHAASDQASRKRPYDPRKATIIAIDPNVDLSGFDPNEFNIYDRPQRRVSEVPDPDIRDEIFRQAGLSAKELELMDAADRDLLYLRATVRSPAEFLEMTPTFKKKNLLRLYSLIRKYESKRNSERR